MVKSVVSLSRFTKGRKPLESSSILNALSVPVLVLDEDDRIRHLNAAAENLLRGSLAILTNVHLTELLPADNPLFSVAEQVRRTGSPVSEYGLKLSSPRVGRHEVNLRATPLPELPGAVVLALQERSIAEQIDRQLTHRGAARSVAGMAAVLAHEVKNPMSGIRGAAQLLEANADADDRALTQLIRDEADRVVALVDRMELFSEQGQISRDPVNIHEVLDHIKKLSESGFGRHVRFVTHFDPSLPPVAGSRDALVQAFLNLVKNACEAVPEVAGEVILKTQYSHGIRFAVSNSAQPVRLPLVVTIQDNGVGIPDALKDAIFDPFVTSKPKGSGLGLALVAKVIHDHGGVIEVDSQPSRTVIRVMLPLLETLPPQITPPPSEEG
ncbi:MAG: two-component system sensor histidine kinase NtrB [Magnetovibrionaceae bacterium]